MTANADTALLHSQLDSPHVLKPFDARRLSDEAARVLADRNRAMQHMTDSLARLRGNLAGLKLETATAWRLLSQRRGILASAGGDRLQQPALPVADSAG
jgi:hypothetical protein